MKKILFASILVTVMILSSLNFDVQAGTVPTFYIQGVTQDEKVTISTQNFPANKVFIARMGLIGTRGINGIAVGSVESGAGGHLKFSFEIPEELYGKNQIAIRLDATSGGYYSYNWFYNKTAGSHTDGEPADEISGIPVVSVLSVKEDTHVVVRIEGFPVDETIDVLMGKYNDVDESGVLVATFTPETDEDLVMVFDIPESLKSESKLDIKFTSQDSDIEVYTWFENTTGSCGGICDYTGIPTISILSVVEDDEVTIKAYNFPEDKDFNVLMGYYGTKGVGGILVGTFNSEAGGSFEKTFEIPEDLYGEYRVAIRLETPDKYFYAYNWFYNNTTDTSVPDGYTGIPTFSITDVVAGETVTIKTNNFPADYDFVVLMGKMWTQGIDGIEVTTINSGEGGAFTATFNIPEALAEDYRISIRLESTTDGFYAYNWFYNNTVNDEDETDGYTGIPTFSISAVVKDKTVTIKANNFPPNIDFNVLMGKMWTQGVGGTYVTSINSGTGGSFTKTFDIPEVYEGFYQISIRMEATKGGYYAYNWFYNVTYP